MTVQSAPDITQTAAEAVQKARDHLLGLQHSDGYWKGELETNVSIEAEDLLLREFLGVRGDRVTQATANWIRAKQRDDGTWANFYGGPPEHSTTTEAYTALKLAGDSADADHMKKAAAYILDAGGIERTRVFTRIWLALFGLWSWERLPVLPPEHIFLPKWAPLNIYDFACWARQTVVALSIVSAYRPVHPIDLNVDEIRSGAPDPPRKGLASGLGAFQLLDRGLQLYQSRNLRPVRELALERAAQWIVRRQEADGSWGGIQPPWVYSLIALSLRGYGLDHPVMAAGLKGLDRFTIWEGDTRRLEACQSPVWDTALAMIALSDAGVDGDHGSISKAADWLLRNEVRVPGDWQLKRPDLAPSGWAFEFANVNYPDVDDTAEVVLALQRANTASSAEIESAMERGIDWTIGMQSVEGGWAAFDADNDRKAAAELPFCDFGAVIDPPSADVTAHAIEMLAGADRDDEPAARRGIEWLRSHQEPDGSWFGRWGANYVYGTGAVVTALVAARTPSADPAIRRAVHWLQRHQNADGGWGEDLRSYRGRSWVGKGESTASQTAWALLALVAGGERGYSVARGARFLIDAQRPDGGWDEPWFTGTGFPGDFYVKYHLYRLIFPLMALGRFVSAQG